MERKNSKYEIHYKKFLKSAEKASIIAIEATGNFINRSLKKLVKYGDIRKISKRIIELSMEYPYFSKGNQVNELGSVFFLTPINTAKKFCNPSITLLISELSEMPDELEMMRLTKVLPDLLQDLQSARLLGSNTKFKLKSNTNFGVVLEVTGAARTNEKTKPGGLDWENKDYQNFYIIPAAKDEMSQPRFILHSCFKIALTYYSRKDSKKTWGEFTSKILEDRQTAEAFSGVKKEKKEAARLMQEQKTIEMFKSLAQSRRINKQIVSILEKFVNQRKTWNIAPLDLDNSLVGNQRYAQFHLELLNDTEFSYVKNLKSTIETALNCDVITIAQTENKAVVKMVISFQKHLQQYQKSFSEILKFNEQDQLFIGETLEGSLVADYNSKALHALFVGESGCGKSVQLTNYLTQLTHLQNYKHEEVYITSSIKVSDFWVFEEAEAHLAEGVDESIKTAQHIMNIAKQRDALFKTERVKNIAEYNQLVPESMKLTRIAFLLDEYETTLQMNKEIETVVSGLLNIGRSCGITVLISTQSLLKQHLGSIRDKMQIKFVGKLKKDVATACGEKEIGEYFTNFDGATEGIFFFQGSTLGLPRERVLHGSSAFQLIQTPFLPDWESYVPKLKGKGVIEVNSIADSRTSILDNIDI